MSEQEFEFITLDEGEKLDPVDEEVRQAAETAEGLIEIESADQLMALAEAAEATFNAFKEMVSDMTEGQARYVRQIRVEEGCSWRAVASMCHEAWDGEWKPPSNQLAGMAICETAAELFGEDYMREPWNG